MCPWVFGYCVLAHGAAYQVAAIALSGSCHQPAAWWSSDLSTSLHTSSRSYCISDSTIEMPIEIFDFPIKNGDFPPDSNFQLSNSPLPTLGRHSQQFPISPATEPQKKSDLGPSWVLCGCPTWPMLEERPSARRKEEQDEKEIQKWYRNDTEMIQKWYM